MGQEGTKAEIPEGLPTHPLCDKRVRRITNLHVVTKPGQDWWRVEQCIGELSGGAPTLIELPVTKLPRRGFAGALVEMFKSQGRFGPIMGIKNPGVLTKVW